MEKTFRLGAGRSWVQIQCRGKCSLKNIADDARVKYLIFSKLILHCGSVDTNSRGLHHM